MSQVTRYAVPLTTTTGGAASGFTPALTGRVTGLIWEPAESNGISGAAIVVTAEDTGETILSVSAISAAEVYHPRVPLCSTSGVALLYAAAGKPLVDAVSVGFGRVEVAITGGGSVKSGTMQVIVE